MTKLHSNQELLKALHNAPAHKPSQDELRQQRVSFIMGSLDENSQVTRAKVEAVLDEMVGK